MSCIFCESLSHLSQNCDIYVSDESRKEVILSKNRCQLCLTDLNEIAHTSFMCQNAQRCYICFSKNHHIFYCPERFTVPKMFLPAIDKDLQPRFFQILDPAERCPVAFSSSEKVTNMKKLIVINNLNNYFIYCKQFLECDFILAEELKLEPFAFNVVDDLPVLNNLTASITKTKYLNIKKRKLSSKDFFHLLSSNLKLLSCSDLTLTPAVKFVHVLRKCPNIERIEICSKTNIKIENSWIRDLLSFITNKNLKSLNLTIDNYEFNVKDLTTLFTEKCAKDVEICLSIISNKLFRNKKKQESLDARLAKYFVPFDNRKGQPLLCIEIGNQTSKFEPLGFYTLKK